ncbi:MAG: benzoate/H(+) symporter BenE family transporter [Alphaproteobacteria bacterium]|nr:benzoate/H(+) symporter BenE family transporter [Alphaproteobacteria bacterium]
MRAEFSTPALAAGVLASFVGFAGTFAVIIRGLTAVGASPEQAASGLLAVSLAMGFGGIVMSLATRQPISFAWSTPGAALLAGTAQVEGGFAGAVGAFLITGVLIILAGQIRSLDRAVAAIPRPIANAMLAGVLLNLCLAPVRAVAVSPAMGLAIILTWAVVAKINRLYAMPAAVLVAAVLVATTADFHAIQPGALWPSAIFIAPHFSLAGLIGLAVPLFIVTMASQNIPGMAVLNLNGYHPDTSRVFTATGVFSLLAAPFGGLSVNLAAITAALCAGTDAHPDPARRYWAATISGTGYVLYGLLASAATVFIAASPPILIEAVAGLALLGAFGGALMGAVSDPADREAAVITFLVAASGVGWFGIGGAFWGLLAGGAMHGLAKWRKK